MSTLKEIGDVLRQARQERGISIDETYARLRIHSNVINDMENGMFSRLNKIYTKSFIKKYAAFLNLDAGKIIRDYEEATSEAPVAVQTAVRTAPPKKERPAAAPVTVKKEKVRKKLKPIKLPRINWKMDWKKVQLVMAAFLSVILAVLVIYFAADVREKVMLRRQEKTAAELRKRRELTVARETGAQPAKTSAARPAEAVKKTATALPASPSARAAAIVTLKATGESWVKVMDDSGRTVYTGTMKAGDSKTLETDGSLTIWTGKGENLELVVNTRKVGKVANGVVKNINVSAKGVKVGDQWVASF